VKQAELFASTREHRRKNNRKSTEHVAPLENTTERRGYIQSELEAKKRPEEEKKNETPEDPVRHKRTGRDKRFVSLCPAVAEKKKKKQKIPPNSQHSRRGTRKGRRQIQNV